MLPQPEVSLLCLKFCFLSLNIILKAKDFFLMELGMYPPESVHYDDDLSQANEPPNPPRDQKEVRDFLLRDHICKACIRHLLNARLLCLLCKLPAMGKATFFCFLLGSLNSESSEPSSTGHREVNWSPREPRSLPRFSYLKETATLRLAPIWWVPKKIFMGIYWGIGESRPCKGGCIGLNGTANAYISVTGFWVPPSWNGIQRVFS